MTISVNGAVPREDLNFSQIFLQQIVSHIFLHQSLGRRNFILQLSGTMNFKSIGHARATPRDIVLRVIVLCSRNFAM